MSAAPSPPGRAHGGRARPLLRFEKYEGLGNDFLVVDAHEQERLDDRALSALCDRHLGVGADGVLLVEEGEPARMIVLNADGSRPEMCGNGLRCVVAHLAARRGLLPGARLVVQTDAGPRACELLTFDPPRAEVRVDMGTAEVGAPFELPFDGGSVRFHPVRTGNPHVVTFDPVDPASLGRLAEAVAAAGSVPGGTNVEIARPADGGLDVVVHERGVGATLACGTGACAALAAACAASLVPAGAKTRVRLPGGELVVSLDPHTSRLTMQGPARRVFAGEAELP